MSTERYYMLGYQNGKQWSSLKTGLAWPGQEKHGQGFKNDWCYAHGWPCV